MSNFADIERAVERLKQQVAAGEIDQKTMQARLIELIALAEDGYYWMYGHKTGLWYRHDGMQWITDNPYTSLTSLPQNKSTPHLNGSTDSPTSSSSNQLLDSYPASIDWLWFILGLIILGVTAGIVYMSSA